jgi:hypothetical protein
LFSKGYPELPEHPPLAFVIIFGKIDSSFSRISVTQTVTQNRSSCFSGLINLQQIWKNCGAEKYSCFSSAGLASRVTLVTCLRSAQT